MALRKIGEAVTDSNGNCIITYTGTGAGEVDLTACYYEEDTGSIIQSEIYSVLDCIVKDTGTSSDHTDNIWNNWNNSATITRESEYTSITKADSSTPASWQISNKPFSNSNLKVEFDVYVGGDSQNLIFAQLRNQGYNVLGQISLATMGLSQNNWHHIILEFAGLNCHIYNTTNSSISDRVFSSEVNKFMFRCDTTASETRYRNFKVYPI